MKTIGAMVGAHLPWRLSARLAGRGAAPGALVWQPAPRVIGDPAIARRLANGVLLFDGRLVETDASQPWDVPAPDSVWEGALHGHAWLDHAAASRDPKIWGAFAAWVWAWLDRYGGGVGPGWSPDLVARRLTRWIAHSVRLLNGQPAERSARFFLALGKQARFVEWRWADTARGVPRIEALAGLVYARISLEGPEREVDRAIADLGREAAATILPDGDIASRSPEALARVLSMLAWSLRNIEESGRKPAPGHAAAIKRALPVLRALRHPSGALARFHGGRPGLDLPLEEIVRAAGPGFTPTQPAPMGYRRLEQGQAVVIADCAMPPANEAAGTAHASALAFEFSYGSQPIVVNCGTGLGFGAKTAITARRAAAHSMLELGGECPGRIESSARREDTDLHLSGLVGARTSMDAQGLWLLGESSVYERRFGLRSERRLHLAAKVDRLEGEDTVLATTGETRARAVASFPDTPCPMLLRFHLHPDVKAAMAFNGRAVALRMPDGSFWIFTADSEQLSIEPSRYYDEERPRPRATSQIVAISHVVEYWGRITRSFERLPEGSSSLSLHADRSD